MNMKWKIVAQFLGAFFIIAIVGNIISSVVASFIVSGGVVTMEKSLVSTDSTLPFIKKIAAAIQEGGIEVFREPGVLKMLKMNNGWIQILDQNGVETQNILKPSLIQISYSEAEIFKLLNGPIEIRGYRVFALYGENFDKNEQDDKKSAVDHAKDATSAKTFPQDITIGEKDVQNSIIPGKNLKDPSIIKRNAVDKENLPKSYFEKGLNITPGYIYIIGILQPKITTNILYGVFDYFTGWNPKNSIPKAISIGLTCLLALLFGYIFAKGITRPVMKITDGISAIASGDYSERYSEEGLYKQVYGSLNNTIKALQAAEMERKKVEQMREDWIVNLSHDLKTPLASIKGYGELLLEPDYELTLEERKKCSEIILNKTRYMEMLLEDLKLTQKLKSDLLPLQKAPGNLVDLLRDVVIDLLNDPRYQDRKVVFEPEEEQIIFPYDPVLMQRAFSNLIHNAVMHNPEDTVVQVRIASSPKLCVTIEDNGNGISKADQQKLFERYYRGTNTDACPTGSGLGLAIAKQVIEAHGGRIQLESEIGTGTRVRVIF